MRKPVSFTVEKRKIKPRSGPRQLSAVGMWKLCRALWQRRGVIACRPSELPEGLREQMQAWADDMYGGRDGF
jgi:hypothetical protein